MKFDIEQIKANAVQAMMAMGIDAVANMQNSVPVATGHLKDNIDWDVTEVGDEIILTITMPSYGENVEYGTPPGTYPDIESLIIWARAKGIPEEAVYGIAEHIWLVGTRPQPFIRPYFNNVMLEDLKRHLKQHFK